MTLLLPPIAFLIVFITVLCITWALSKLAAPTASSKPLGKGEVYACGEEYLDTLIQPDYAQFFPFAFFFTIMHVVVLTIALVPAGSLRFHPVVIIYLLAAFIGLLILLRRDK